MQLQSNRIGGEAHAGQPRPLQRVLAFLDVLFRRAAVIVKGKHPLVGQAAIGDQEADSREQFTRMELDLGDKAPGLRSALWRQRLASRFERRTISSTTLASSLVLSTNLPA